MLMMVGWFLLVGWCAPAPSPDAPPTEDTSESLMVIDAYACEDAYVKVTVSMAGRRTALLSIILASSVEAQPGENLVARWPPPRHGVDSCE